MSCPKCGAPNWLTCRECYRDRHGDDAEAAFLLSVGWLVLLACLALALTWGNVQAG